MTLRPSLATLLFLLAAPIALAEHTLTVSAGPHDRVGALVSFDLPIDASTRLWTLRGQKDAILPVQSDGQGHAWFILPELKAGQTATFTLEGTPNQPSPLALAREADVLKITASGKPVLTYQGSPGQLPPGIEPVFTRGGYIHPVFTPSGKLVTDDFAPDHKHHHGIWSPWTKTEFEGRHPDFWNMGTKTGTVLFKGIDATWSGPVAAGWRSQHQMVDLSASPAKPAINEQWEVNVYTPGSSPRPYHIVDLTITQTAASESPLLLPKYHYGGLGYRGHRQWKDKANCFMLTSEGKDRSNGNETRGRWCHMSGKVDGELAGVAVLDHPSNFRHPQPMRLNPSDPFFCYAPSQLGDWMIEQGKPYVARYRFIISDGGPDKEMLDRLWNDYAHPPEVVMK